MKMYIIKQKVDRYTKKKTCEMCGKKIEKGKYRYAIIGYNSYGHETTNVYCSKGCIRGMISVCLEDL